MADEYKMRDIEAPVVYGNILWALSRAAYYSMTIRNKLLSDSNVRFPSLVRALKS